MSAIFHVREPRTDIARFSALLVLGLGLAVLPACRPSDKACPSSDNCKPGEQGGSCCAARAATKPAASAIDPVKPDDKKPGEAVPTQDAAPAKVDAAPPVAKVPAADPAVREADAVKILFDGKMLKGWTVSDFSGKGQVGVEDGTIVMGVGGDLTGVTYEGQPPKENYEITLEGQRLDGDDFFCTTTYPVGEEHCSLVVGGWGGSLVGLSNIDGYDAANNPTTQIIEFKNKQWYHVRIRVSAARVECWIDEKQMVNQERAGHKFSVRGEVDESQPLGIATWRTKGAVRNIRLRMLTPEEIKASAEAKPAED